jgi:hypothetical protein
MKTIGLMLMLACITWMGYEIYLGNHAVLSAFIILFCITTIINLFRAK